MTIAWAFAGRWAWHHGMGGLTFLAFRVINTLGLDWLASRRLAGFGTLDIGHWPRRHLD